MATAANSEMKKRSLRQAAGGKLYSVAFSPGWTRRLVLAGAALLCVLSALYLTCSTDYREDPSALVPRSADLYAETRNLPELLATAGAWRLWNADRRGVSEESRSDLERELAGRVSSRVAGLPVNPPLRWMTASTGAALAVSRDDAGESWALYLRLENPGDALKDIEVEPGLKLEAAQGARGGDGVFVVTGQGGGSVTLGVAGPWLIFSNDAKLPEFALEARRRPALSLAGSDIVPRWRGSAGARGVFSPAYAAGESLLFGPSFAADWLAPRARVAYTALLGRNGGVEAHFTSAELEDGVPGIGLRPLYFIIMAAVGLVSLGVALSILLVMIGWGGVFKMLAKKAGIAPAKEPEPVEPSAAFREDSGESAGGEEPSLPEQSESGITGFGSDTKQGSDDKNN